MLISSSKIIILVLATWDIRSKKLVADCAIWPFSAPFHFASKQMAGELLTVLFPALF